MNVKAILDAFNQKGDDENEEELFEFLMEGDTNLASEGAGVSMKMSLKLTKKPRNPIAEKEEKANEEMIVPEEKLEGNPGYQDYKNLFSFSIGQSAIWIFLLSSLFIALLQLAPSYLVSKWVTMDYEGQQSADDLVLYFCLSVGGLIVMGLARTVFWSATFLNASSNMHNCMAEKVVRSHILFFDSNPIGRVTTRFSKDMVILD